MTEFKSTAKQREIMELVLGAANDGAFLPLQDLYTKLSWAPDVSIQSIQCSMKFLAKHGMVDPYRERGRTYYKPTAIAYARYRSG